MTSSSIQSVGKSVENELSTSTQRRGMQLANYRLSLQSIVTKSLNMFTYKIQMLEQLVPLVYQICVAYSPRLLQLNNDIRNCFVFLKKLLKSREVSSVAKVRIYRSVIMPTTVYGSETWMLIKKNEMKREVWERKF